VLVHPYRLLRARSNCSSKLDTLFYLREACLALGEFRSTHWPFVAWMRQLVALFRGKARSRGTQGILLYNGTRWISDCIQAKDNKGNLTHLAAFPASTLPRSKRETSMIPLQLSKSLTFSGLSTRAQRSVSRVISASVGDDVSLPDLCPKRDCVKSK
jgi:hypothetical protein